VSTDESNSFARIGMQERREAIELQCRWAVDRRDWPTALSCFTEDASTDLPHTGRNDDVRGMIAAARQIVERLEATQHHLSNHLVNLTLSGLMVQCYVMAQHVRSVDGHLVTFTFGGRYTDQLDRASGSLRIKHRQLEIIWSTGDQSILRS